LSLIIDYEKNLKIPKGQSEDVIRRRTNNTMSKRIRTKRQIMVNKKAMHKQQNIEQHEPPINTGESPGAPEEQTVPAPLVAAVMLPLNDAPIIWQGKRIGHQYK
jgi:hypothetical protein